MPNGKFSAGNQSQIAETTLDLLDAVAEEAEFSQRSLADRLGVALGLTNAVLKRCAKKGLLKIRQAPARRFAYYLTPQGFAEKSRLTAEYLGHSLRFYREARQEYGEVFSYCAKRKWFRIVLVGATELTEIATLATAGSGVEIVGVLDPERNEEVFCGLPVLRNLDEIAPTERPHAVVLGDITDPQAAYDRLVAVMPPERVLAPKVLRVLTMASSQPSTVAEEER